MRRKVPNLAPLVNGWQVPAETMGVYGNHYLKRATLAMVGLGPNPPEDAIYPLAFTDGDGKPLHGDHDYTLHFGPHELPPVGAFWSLTLYDQDGFQVPTRSTGAPWGTGTRCAHRWLPRPPYPAGRPRPGANANWLPSPRGPFALFLRLYEPNAEVLDGRWRPPGVRRRQ